VKGKPVRHQDEMQKLRVASTIFQEIKDEGHVDDRKACDVDDLARMYGISREAAVVLRKMLDAA
jgi:hypothetical protein